jgi:hypothetical protein
MVWEGTSLLGVLSLNLTFPKSQFVGEQSNTRDGMKHFCFRVATASCLGFYLLLWFLSQHDN